MCTQIDLSSLDETVLDNLEDLCGEEYGPKKLGREISTILFPTQEPVSPLEIFFSTSHERVFCLPFEAIAPHGRPWLWEKGRSVVRILVPNMEWPPAQLPLKVLVVVASPRGHARIDANRVIEDTRAAVASCFGEEPFGHQITSFNFVTGPDTKAQLRELRDSSKWYHIVEFIAHGEHDQHHGGRLCLEDSQSDDAFVDGGELASLLPVTTDRVLPLVILNSCKSGGGDPPGTGELSNLAWHLLHHGAQAVISMQTEVGIDTVLLARRTFYTELLAPETLDGCVSKMRSVMDTERFALMLSTREAYDQGRRFFSPEALDVLKKISQRNTSVDELFSRAKDDKPEGYLELVNYLVKLKASDPSSLGLIARRDEIADLILDHVANELRCRPDDSGSAVSDSQDLLTHLYLVPDLSGRYAKPYRDRLQQLAELFSKQVTQQAAQLVQIQQELKDTKGQLKQTQQELKEAKRQLDHRWRGKPVPILIGFCGLLIFGFLMGGTWDRLFHSSNLNPDVCVALDVKTFTVDEETVEAGSVYTATLTGEIRPDLFIKPNLIALPLGCQPQLEIRWSVSDDHGTIGLQNWDDFAEIGHQAPAPGEIEIIRVQIREETAEIELNTFLILRSTGQEQSKGGSQ